MLEEGKVLIFLISVEVVEERVVEGRLVEAGKVLVNDDKVVEEREV